MKIAISCDSTCDIPKNLIEEYDIHLMPITILLGSEERKDGIDVTAQDVFDYADRTGELARTSAVNVYEYLEFFKKLRESYDAVIHFSLSFAISSTGTNALNASHDVDNVYVIDLFRYGPSYASGTNFRDSFFLGGHMNAAGYEYTAWMFMTYIDWIIRNNMDDFSQVAFIGTDYEY